MTAYVLNEGRVFGLKPLECSVLLSSVALGGILILLF